jgi:hypothetical protein
VRGARWRSEKTIQLCLREKGSGEGGAYLCRSMSEEVHLVVNRFSLRLVRRALVDIDIFGRSHPLRFISSW